MQINLAGCVIIDDDSILLLHRIKNDWYELPGGKIDEREDSAHAAVRELKEELKVDVELIKVLGQKDFEENGFVMGYTWHLAKIKENQKPAIGEPEKFDHFKYIKITELSLYPLSLNMKNLFEEIGAGRINL
jgi:8-oxo-dGTP pyrophosphatase MutT (NUDIX family)